MRENRADGLGGQGFQGKTVRDGVCSRLSGGEIVVLLLEMRKEGRSGL